MLHKINYAKLYMLHIESGPDILFFLQIFQESKKTGLLQSCLQFIFDFYIFGIKRFILVINQVPVLHSF